MSELHPALQFGAPLAADPLLEALLPDAVAQLARDFAGAGCEAGFEGVHFINVFDFRDAVAARLGHPSVSPHLQQLLYRVDVPEKNIKSALAKAVSPEAVLAELMIIRALQKVWLRCNYGK
ncbi:MAG: hypothetical protein IM638_19010 [Bacteroidetes bacterium]|nr:hypothetical protein [Bacteroidota bacterium]